MRDFHLPGRSAIYATNGACATSHPIATGVALDILNRGGNAMDAAIAGAVLLGLAEPAMTGLGGDCFALFRLPGEPQVRGLNGSGRAPRAADAAGLRAKGHPRVPENSAHAVTIPGAVDAFCHLSETYGKLGLEDLLAPSIQYAEQGIPVAPRAAFDWAQAADRLQGPARQAFLFGGQVPKTGTLFRAPRQADVLRKIAAQGRRGFYEGDVAEDMVATLNSFGGAHTLQDFAATTCDATVPVSSTYRGATLYEHPPNGQGVAANLMLNILGQFDIGAMDPMGLDRAHMETEAAKLAYDARDRYIADPNSTQGLDHMLAPDTAVRLAGLIDPARAMPTPGPLTEALHRDTVYITVVDRDRMAVSLIYSIFHSFGSGIASNRYGILFQNRGAGFTLTDGHPNMLAGGKRPMHTIIPAMLEWNGAWMPFGVMGGAYQPTGHARLVSNLVDFGMDLQSAVDAARLFPDPESGKVRIERGYDPEVRNGLGLMGHDLVIPDAPIGGAQAIVIRPDGVLEAASDPRKDGCALGY